MIKVNDYEDLVKEINRDDIIFCPLEHTAELFQRFTNEKRNGISKKYTVVSAASDYSLVYQKEYHPNNDAQKHFYMIDWANEINKPGYLAIQLGPAASKSCDYNHKFAVKIYAHTIFTFDKIPSSINKWFVTNCLVDEPQCVALPFGINSHGDGWKNITKYKKPWNEKSNTLYVNFTDNTIERAWYKKYFAGQDWVVFQPNNIPHDQFCEEMSNCKFVLSPIGNGFDCYRTYEAIELGSIPIVEDNNLSRHLSNLNLPMVRMPNLLHIKEDTMYNLDEVVTNYNFNEEALDINYWEKKIRG